MDSLISNLHLMSDPFHGADMKLTHIKVDNYKGLRETQCKLSDFVCAIGENGMRDAHEYMISVK